MSCKFSLNEIELELMMTVLPIKVFFLFSRVKCLVTTWVMWWSVEWMLPSVVSRVTFRITAVNLVGESSPSTPSSLYAPDCQEMTENLASCSCSPNRQSEKLKLKRFSQITFLKCQSFSTKLISKLHLIF